MSRKHFSDKSSWKVPTLFFFVAGYGPSRPKPFEPIEDVTVVLYGGNDDSVSSDPTDQKHEGWLQEARIGEHTPETEEYGIGSFTYRASRPFLPHKLNLVLEAMLNKASPPFDNSTILRAKGFIWLANSPQIQGELSLTGNHFSLVPGNPWWAEIDKTHWPENLERDIAPLWHKVHGDRQQEIVIIGQSLDRAAVTLALDECLVSEAETEQGQEAWNVICSQVADPFQEDWDTAIELAQKEMDDHGHDHSHDHSHGESCGDETCTDERTHRLSLADSLPISA